jgi:hypothetical protein
MDVDAILCLFVCADVGPRGREVEWVRASAHQGPVRPPWGEPRVGERRRREDVEVRPAGEERVARRHVVLMTLVQGHHMLLRPRPGEILRIFVAAWRWCYRVCLRACGHASRMRVS